MGNSRAKPMLSRDFPEQRLHPVSPLSALREAIVQLQGREILLPVTCQDLVAGRGQLRAILLKARQDDEIALINQRTAKALDVARASLLLVRRAAALLRDSAGRNGYRQKRKRIEKFSHCVPSF
jgi:hypothetical protein